MAKRIEQAPLVSESSLPIDEPAEPIRVPPTLRLVGGTDVTPPSPDPSPHLRP